MHMRIQEKLKAKQIEDETQMDMGESVEPGSENALRSERNFQRAIVRKAANEDAMVRRYV